MKPLDPHATAIRHYGEHYYEGQLKVDADVKSLKRSYVYRKYVTNNDTVLDFGCADGSVLDALPGRRKAGVEVNPVAREAGLKKGVDVRSSLDDFDGEKFTRIISSHVLEHVVDPAHTLARLRDHLEVDGMLLLILPMNDCRDRRHRRWQPDDLNMHVYAWTPLTLGNLLSVAGFEPQSVYVLKQMFPRGAERLARISPQLYIWAGRLCAIVRPRHQVVAIARPKNSGE